MVYIIRHGLFRAVYAWNRVLYFNTEKRSSLYKMNGGMLKWT